MLQTHLLPEGLRDRLPPFAESADRAARAAMDVLRGHGYARVAPPIAEFRETLSGEGDGGGGDLLRFTDPVSRRTLAIRPDITRQIGRIASSRLAGAPRPLRLSYAGQVVKLSATTLWPDREMSQIGAELIGIDSVAAVAEIVGLAVEALAGAGARDITVDLTLPDLVDTLAAAALPLPAERIGAVKAELDAKDAGALAALGAEAYLPLIAATGPFETAVARLEAIDAGGALASRIAALRTIAASLAGKAAVTLDPSERHGFEYQSWIGFSIFVRGLAVTIGRGGSYRVPHGGGDTEPAVGFSLYLDPLIDAGALPSAPTRSIFLPLGHDAAAAAALRRDGWITLAALSHDDKGACGWVLTPDGPRPTGEQ